MIPFLTYPLALIGLATLPVLAAIYILRNRYRRQPVSSLMLWRQQTQVKEGGFKVDRLQLPWIFFIELLALLLLVVAATGPRWQLPSTIRPLIVVADNSQSMLAGIAAGTPRQRAEKDLRELMANRRFRSVRVVLAGIDPRAVTTPVEGNYSLDDLLKEWTCTEPAGNLDAAMVMAAELARQEADILVLTDQAPPPESLLEKKVRWWSFGRALPNLALVNARRSMHGEADRCLLEIANYSSNVQTASLTVKAGASTLRQSTLTIKPGANERVVFNVPGTTPMLEADLPDDLLAIDNRVRLLPPPRKKVRVQTALADESLNALVRRAVEATGLSLPVGTNADLIIHQMPQVRLGPHAWDLRIITGEKATPYTGPFLLDPSHPLNQGIDLNGVIWAAPTTNRMSGLPVISAGNTPLLSAQADALNRQHLTLQITPESSTLPASPNWPALFWNLLNWRLSESPGLREANIRLGAEAEYATQEASLRMGSPDGRSREIPVRASPILVRPESCGIYALVTAQSTNLLAVNFLAPQESDLTSCITGRWGEWRNEREIRYEYESVLWVFLMLALVALTIHLITLARSKASI